MVKKKQKLEMNYIDQMQFNLNDYEGIQWRTRVTIKESSDGDDIVYRIKIASEVAPLNANSVEYYQPIGRVLKFYEPMISEFQARLGSF